MRGPLLTLVIAAVLALARAAAADVPEFFPACKEERGRCTECVLPMSSARYPSYEACRDAVADAGLVETCQYTKQGAIRTFYCSPEHRARKQASSGCALSHGDGAGVSVAAALAFCLALACRFGSGRRRRRRSRWGPP
jgi:hypothetical protein